MPFILLVIGIVLIIYSYRGIKKEAVIKQENDSLNISFRSVLEDSKEEVNDYKVEIGLLRRDIAESLTELQEEISDIKNNLNRLKNSPKTYENKEYFEKSNLSNEENSYDIMDNSSYRKVTYEDIIEEENLRTVDYLINEDSSLNLKDEVIDKIDYIENIDSSKTQNIKMLLSEGLTEEEICHKLAVSKGEVLLVKGLFKK